MYWSFEEKLHAVKSILSGESKKMVAKRLSTDEHRLSVLCDRYLKYGEAGLHRKPHHQHSAIEKEKIVRLHVEKGVSLRELNARYDVSTGSILKWVRLVRDKGYLELYKPDDHDEFNTKNRAPYFTRINPSIR